MQHNEDTSVKITKRKLFSLKWTNDESCYKFIISERQTERAIVNCMHVSSGLLLTIRIVSYPIYLDSAIWNKLRNESHSLLLRKSLLWKSVLSSINSNISLTFINFCCYCFHVCFKFFPHSIHISYFNPIL